jgi:multicomponent Na+:H+ antiporter subunit D
MCAAQHHLKRMLAFATVAQSGMFLAGLGLLDISGTAGVAIWLVADGLVKAALFACVAVLQHRFDRIEERDLHGRGRSLWPVGVLFALAALAIASLPPFGSFEGRALVEDAAKAYPGFGWLPALLSVTCALVAGTLLRVAARVFGGWGTRAGEGLGADEGPADEEAGRAPAVLWAPAALLVAAAVAWGLVPGLRDTVATAAAQFIDTGGYARAVLDGRHAGTGPQHLAAPGASAYLYALLSVAGAVMIAAAALRGAGARTASAVRWLRALHDGRPGGYVAWASAGAAALTGVLSVVLR